MLNIVTIHAIRKTLSLPKTFKLKTLLPSLAVSDVGVGFSVQPFYSALPTSAYKERIPAVTYLKSFTSLHIYLPQLRSGVLWF